MSSDQKPDLGVAVKSLWLALRGGQQDAIDLWAGLEEKMIVFDELGVDRDEALEMARMCAIAGVNAGELAGLLNKWMRGDDDLPTPDPFQKTLGYRVSWRDRLAGGLANWAMTTFATTAYLNFVYLLTKLGRDELDRRLKEGRDD